MQTTKLDSHLHFKNKLHLSLYIELYNEITVFFSKLTHGLGGKGNQRRPTQTEGKQANSTLKGLIWN